MKNATIFSALLVAFASTVIAQEKASIYLSLQHAFVSGFKLDLEKPLKSDSQTAILISPELYYNNTGNFSNFDEMTGAGFDLMLRRYLTPGKVSYLSAGVHYNYFSFSYDREDWVLVDDQYLLQDINLKEGMHKVGLNCIMGGRFDIPGNLWIDLYGGVGFRVSFFNEDKPYDRHNDSVFDFGYAGPIPLIAVRVGAKL